MKKWYFRIKNFMRRMREDHISAYAAQAAYFVILSFIPIIMLVLQIINYTPVNSADLLKLLEEAVPTYVYPLVLSIITETYNRTISIIPITVIIIIWSAGRGVLAFTKGFNCIYNVHETRNYVALRIRSSVYTIFFILSLVITLLLMVFGNPIHLFLVKRIPIIAGISSIIISFRTVITLCILIIFYMFLYCFLPNRKASFVLQFPGATVTAVLWSAFSFFFSIYIDHFSNYSKIYGSLTTLIIVMVWLYICMYIVMIGAAVNSYYEERFKIFRENRRRKKFIRKNRESEEE